MPDFRRRAVRERMTVRLDAERHAGTRRSGAEGLARGEVDALGDRARRSASALPADAARGRRAARVRPAAADGGAAGASPSWRGEVREEVDTLVVLGIGGSALGSRAILERLGGGTPRVAVADNVDPWSFGALLDSLDLARTAFNVVSKSGETAATMAQFLIVRDRLLRALGAIDYKPRVIITTDAERGSLRQIVNDEGFRDLAVPAGVGGRFSVLTAAGLFPAAFAGVRDRGCARRRGLDGCARCTPRRCGRTRRICSAALLYLAETQAAKAHRRADAVQRPAARLCALVRAALGGEPRPRPSTSRATRRTAARRRCRRSAPPTSTRSCSSSSTGPPDKVVLFLRVEDHGREIEIPSAYDDLEGVGYLQRQGPRRAAQHGAARHRAGAAAARPHVADAVGAAAQRVHARPAVLSVRGGDGVRRRAASGRTAATSRRRRRDGSLTFGLAGRKGVGRSGSGGGGMAGGASRARTSCERAAGAERRAARARAARRDRRPDRRRRGGRAAGVGGEGAGRERARRRRARTSRVELEQAGSGADRGASTTARAWAPTTP